MEWDILHLIYQLLFNVIGRVLFRLQLGSFVLPEPLD